MCVWIQVAQRPHVTNTKSTQPQFSDASRRMPRVYTYTYIYGYTTYTHMYRYCLHMYVIYMYI